ncbi:MAG: thioesterase family protein [Aquificaceae bacterium]
MTSLVGSADFRYRRRAHFHETDAQGVVHHSVFFKYLEETRSEFLRSRGLPYETIIEKGFEVPVVELKCRFHRPIFHADVFDVLLWVREVNRWSFSFYYEIFKDNLVAKAYSKHCLIYNKELSTIPDEILFILKSS